MVCNVGEKRDASGFHSNGSVALKSARSAKALYGVHVEALSPNGLAIELNGTAFHEDRRQVLLDLFSKAQSIVFRYCLGTSEMLDLLAQSGSNLQKLTVITPDESVHEKLQNIGMRCLHLQKLSWARFIGEEPATISFVLNAMPRLTGVNLNVPHFEKNLVSPLHSNLRKVTLHLYKVPDLDRALPLFVRALPQLHSLKLYDPHALTDRGLFEMAPSCRALRKWHLISHPMTQYLSDLGVSAFLSHCTGLQALKLAVELPLSSSFVEAVNRISTLEKLELDSFIESNPPSASPLALSGQMLRHVVFRIARENMSIVAQLPALTRFRAMYSLAIEIQPVAFRSLATLRTLELSLDHENQLQEALVQIPLLEVLSTQINQQPTDTFVQHLAQHCTRLQELEMGSALSLSQITDKAFLALAQGCKCLRKLVLGTVDHLTPASVMAIGKSCTQLTHLNIQPKEETCYAFDDRVLAQLQNCKQLQELSMQCWHGFTMNGFGSALGAWPNIVKLHLGHCHGLKDTAALLRLLARTAPRLSELLVEGADLTPEEGKKAANEMVARGMNMREIRLLGGNTLTEEMILIFLRGMPRLEAFIAPFNLTEKGGGALDWRKTYDIR